MKNLLLALFVILTSICFGQIDMKIYKKNGQVEAVPISQVDSVKYTTSSPLMMNVYKNNNSAILSVLINDIDSIKYLSNSIPVGSITGLDCGTAINNGTLTANTVASGVNSVISYTGGNGGTYSNQTIQSTGVLGLTATLAAGTFANGNGTLTYEISGTPTSNGTASFELIIGGKTCILTRDIALPVGVIATLECGTAINNGTLTENVVASGVSSEISYTSGNGGTYSNQTIQSTGVLDLTATLAAGTFANGNGTLTYEISGTPTSNGTASFELIIGGKTCTLTRDIALPVGVIATLECGTAINNGTLTENVIASGVSSEISYTGGNGGTYSNQTIQSTGVLGLTATLAAGTFANGNGTLTYEISGTPTSNGTASFELIIGGKTCTLTRDIALPVGVIATLECGTAINNGTLTENVVASGVSSEISYTGGNGGTYSNQTIQSTGVLGLTATLAAGTFANGNGTLIYEITGTPTSNGIASFELIIGGITCTLTRDIALPLPVGAIATLDCGNAINNGLITYEAAFEIETPSNLKGFYNFGFGDSRLNAGWGNGLLINQSIHGELKLVNSIDSLAGVELSEDFTGKIALIYRGTYGYALKALNAQKAGAIAVVIMNHGIQTNGSVNETQVLFMGGMLTGETATNATGLQVNIPLIMISKQDRDKIITEIKNGSIIMANIGAKIVKDVNSVISYTGGNGGTYIGQTITSTGVTGLTATLDAGIIAAGNGTLVFSISGVPNSSGDALFLLNIAGKTCTFSMKVQNPTRGYAPTITDTESNTYKTVYIGTQQWMAENLKVSKYSDGTDIPNISDDNQWMNLTTDAWVYYNNDVANNAKYGKLYNWFAVSPTTNGNKNVCPTGWHIPADAEWTVLTDYLGGENVAGGKMKEVGTTSWYGPNTNAIDNYGFTGLPGGVRWDGGMYGQYLQKTYYGYWWSSTEDHLNSGAFARRLGFDNGSVVGGNWGKGLGLSVRCLKD